MRGAREDRPVAWRRPTPTLALADREDPPTAWRRPTPTLALADREDRPMAWRRLTLLAALAALAAAPARAAAGPEITLTAGPTLKVRDGAVRITVACPPTAVGSCEATATLRTKVKQR